ncbi:MAG: site-specific DNA-methyltransferase [bacterium]|nr:site-specific DNA-methyltransferase [bacterium]
MNKGKLELTWVCKYDQLILEPRVLIEDTTKSYGDPNTENMLIYGDNLLALKALEQDFAGQIKCIYIDPPYNTGNAFEHYDDGLEHSIWLNLMKPRLDILKKLLRKDGFFCCHIDDSEGSYIKVLLDEIFGRSNYMTTFYIRVRYPDKTLKSDMDYHKEIEQVHIYRKEYGATPNLNKEESNFDKFKYYIKELSVGKQMELRGKKVIVFQKNQYEIIEGEGTETGLKEIWASGSILDGNSSGRFFRDYLTGRYKIDGYGVLYKVSDIGEDAYDYRYFTGPKRVGAEKGKYYQGVPKSQLIEKNGFRESPINNFYDLAASFGNCRTEGGVSFRSGKKPEKLLEIILRHFSNKNDWILDSFLGSGTTAAVAHKMNRKWIGIELGEHCHTHCLPRLKSVVDGTDQSGISKSVNWKGGGGFKYYSLAESLLVRDKDLSTKNHPVYIINPQYDEQMLIKAICKIENFKYRNEGRLHGISSENRFLHITTQLVTQKYLDSLIEDIRSSESLLIYCTRYKRNLIMPDTIEIKRIPRDLLHKCDFQEDK